MNIVDLIILIILAACALGGYTKGLIRSVFSLCSFIAAIILTNLFYPTVSLVLKGTALYDSIKSGIFNAINLEEVIQKGEAGVQESLSKAFNLPAWLAEGYVQSNSVSGSLNLAGLQDNVASYLAQIVINLIAIIIVFVLVNLLLKILGNSLDLISRLPGINFLNKSGGLVIGFLLGIFTVWLLLTISTLFIANPNYSDFMKLLEDSYLVQFFYNTNIFMSMVFKEIK